MSRRRMCLGSVLLALFVVSAPEHALATSDLRLVEAVKHRDTKAVPGLLKQHVDVNTPQPDGATALHWAAHWDDLETANLLIRAGANLNAANESGVTPLSIACNDGSAAMVEALLKAGANPNDALSTGETALMSAARTGRLGGVNALLARGADVHAKEKVRGQTALMWAVAEKHEDVARTLIEHGANVRARSNSGFTALMFAAREGDLNLARLLLAHGADLNETDSDGASVLLVATVRGHAELVMWLLDRGANPNDDRAGYTALHWAAGTSETGSTYDLHQIESGEWSALSGIPTKEAKLAVITALLAHGANANARITKDPPRFGYSQFKRQYLMAATPFYLAAQAGDVDVMRLLLAHGADPLLASKDSTPPLVVAAGVAQGSGESRVPESRHLDAVRFLLELGADINQANAAGLNALHAATYAGFDAVVQFLVDKGIKVNEKTKVGQTALGIAEGNFLSGFFFERPSTAALLRKVGAISEGAVTLESFIKGKVRRSGADESQPPESSQANEPPKAESPTSQVPTIQR